VTGVGKQICRFVQRAQLQSAGLREDHAGLLA
jgi:hypothetical protein